MKSGTKRTLLFASYCTLAFSSASALALNTAPQPSPNDAEPLTSAAENSATNAATQSADQASETTADPEETASTEQGEGPVEVIHVVGTRDEQRLNPRGAQIRGPFGLDKALSDIGRSITPVSREQIVDNALTDINDLRRVAPGTFGAMGFGSASLPTIRGQLGEVMTNGIRRQGGNNGFGIPLSFNSAEQLDIASGTPPVAVGTTQRVGGFLNVQAKRPQLEQSFTQLRASASRWSRYGGQLDTSQVLEEGVSGVRLSVEIRDEDSFFDYTEHRSSNVFAAWRQRLSDRSEINVSYEFYDVEFTDNAGLNRPTQSLIDDGWYITGQGQQPNGSYVPGPQAVITPTGQVQIPRSMVQTDPDNISDARTHVWHVTYDHELSDNWWLTNRTYAESMSRNNISQNSFVEIIDDATTAENRLELYYQPNERQQWQFGAGLRYNSVLGYSQFTTEADNPSDLTGPLENRRIPLTPAQQERLVQLRPGLFVSPGAQYDRTGDGVGDYNLSDTTDSTSWQYGLFVQHDFQFAPEWTLTTGLRGDWYDVTARDPIAPEGFSPARDSINRFLKAGELNLLYQPNRYLSFYATSSYSESTSNSMAGGTVLGPDNQINPDNFATESELYEVGVKWTPANQNWYGDLALFDQTRNLRNRDGSNTGIATQGLEARLHYTGQQFSGRLGFNYLDARYNDATASQGTRQVADAFDDSRPDLIEGTGVGSPNFTVFENSTARVQGLPRVSANLGLRYQLNNQWRVGADGIYTETYPLDYLATVMIRDQYEVNAHLAYQVQAQTEIRLDGFNLTNQDNWAPTFEGGYFGATLAMPNLPRHWQLSVRHQF